MSMRKTTADPATAELARRRLSQLSAELTASTGREPGPLASGAGPVVSPVVGPAAGSAAGLAPHPGPGPGPDPGPDRTATAATSSAAGAVPGVTDVLPVAAARPGRHARQRASAGRRLAARLVDAVPPGMQGQFGITAQHVTVVALVLAAAMAFAAWLVVRSAPQPAPAVHRASLRLPPMQPAAGPGGSMPAGMEQTAGVVSPTTPGATPVRVVVHVTGKVRRPGVVELADGARVVDAIEAAGGARPGAHLGRLNLARLVLDGEQIAVGVPPASVPTPAVTAGTVPPVLPSAGAVPVALVNLNTANQAELEELPGVGPVTATSIIEWRTEHGGFSTVDELLEVSGIGEVTLGELRDLVTV